VLFSQTQLLHFLGAAAVPRQLPVVVRLEKIQLLAHERCKNRLAPVFVCLSVEICVTVVSNCSRLDTTHFAMLGRMFKSFI
jgi:hypothetical protein